MSRMLSISCEDFYAALRLDFYTFCERAFRELYPGETFVSNWHLIILSQELQDVLAGKSKRLIVNLPPRHLKSFLVSVALVAFWLGHHPTAQIICASYGQDLADKLARDCRALMMSNFYQQLFKTRLIQSPLNELMTTEGGFRLATSVGGVLTGRGGDLIIIDDPIKPDDALSQTQRNVANHWFAHTALSRLNNKQEGKIIVVMQRLHEDDLAGHLLCQGGWHLLKFPAIAEDAQDYEVKTVLGTFRYLRKAGEVLHAERESIETLNDIRSSIGAYHFAGQYQQSPAPSGGGLIKTDWFVRYSPNELPEQFDETIQSWDCAAKPGELNDYSVCTTWRVKSKRYYLLDVFRRKLDYPGLKRAVLQLASHHQPSAVIIEDKSSGTALIQDLREAGVPVSAFVPKDDKIVRMSVRSPLIESGFVLVPKEAHWLAEYLHEMETFPKGRHDDQVDSTSQMLTWISARFPGWGILQFYEENSRAHRAGAQRLRVRIRAPAGFPSTHIITISGEVFPVPPDSVIAVIEDDVPSLVAQGWTRVAPVLSALG